MSWFNGSKQRNLTKDQAPNPPSTGGREKPFTSVDSVSDKPRVDCSRETPDDSGSGGKLSRTIMSPDFDDSRGIIPEDVAGGLRLEL